MPSLTGVFSAMVGLWRRDRALLLPVVGLFYFLPLAVQLLLIPLPPPRPDATGETLLAAIYDYYATNAPIIALLLLVIAFGTTIILSLYLGGARPTLGEAIGAAFRRFPVYLALTVLSGLACMVGFLLIVPGLYLSGRTLLVGAHSVARPDRPVAALFSESVAFTRGRAWQLAAMWVVILIGLQAGQFLSGAIDALMTASGLPEPLAGLPSALLSSLVGAIGYLANALLQVVIYRALARSRQGI